MPSKNTRRIERELGITGLLDALGKAPASDLQSLLMEVYAVRATAVNVPAALAQAGRERLTAPSPVSARDLGILDRVAFEAASGFDALELSPVCPFGTTHALGGISQNNVL